MVRLLLLIAVAFAPSARGQEPGATVPASALLTIDWMGADALAPAYRDTSLHDLTSDPAARQLVGFLEELIRVLPGTANDPTVSRTLGITQQLGLFAKHPWTLTVLDIPQFAGPPEIALTMKAGDDAAAVAELVAAATGGADGPGVSSVSVLGNTMRQVLLPLSEDPIALVSGRVGDHFVLAVGAGTAEKIVPFLAGDNPLSLSRDASFVSLHQRTRGTGTTALSAHVDVRLLVAKTVSALLSRTLIDPEHAKIPATLGLGGIGKVHFDVSITDRGFRSALFAEMKKSGIDEETISDHDLVAVPKGSHYFSLFDLDLASAYDRCLELVDILRPGMSQRVADQIAGVEGTLGFGIREEFLAALGKRFLLFEDPDLRSLIPGFVLAIDGCDREKLDRCLRLIVSFAGRMAEARGVTVEARFFEREGVRLDFVHIGGVPSPVAPAWTWVGSKLVLSLQPAGVEHVLMRHARRNPREMSILEDADFQRARRLMPEKPRTLEYSNIGGAVGNYYPTFVCVADVLLTAASQLGVNGDASMVPSPLLVRRSLFGQIAATEHHDDGWSCVFHGPLPVSAGVVPASGAGALAGVVLFFTGRRVEQGNEVRERAMELQSMTSMDYLGILTMTYRADTGKVPQTWEELEKANPDLTEKQLRSPFGNESHYVMLRGFDRFAPPDLLYIYDPEVDSRGRMAVMTVGGRIDALPEEEARRQIQRAQQWLEKTSTDD